MGIMGIERSIEKSQQETSKNVSAVSRTGDCTIRELFYTTGIQGPQCAH